MKQIYIMGFNNPDDLEGRKAPTSNALKNIRVQYETTTFKNDRINEKNHFEDKRVLPLLNIFKNWQDKNFDFEQNLKSSKKRKKNLSEKQALLEEQKMYLITAKEFLYQLNEKFQRLQEVANKVEGINWSKRNDQDYYFLCESGEFKHQYIKLEEKISFGRRIGPEHDARDEENWLLFEKDKKVSKIHFSVDIEPKNREVYVQDLGSSSGTWLALMHHVEEEIVPEVVYRSALLDCFSFDLGIRCDNIEEILGYYERYDLIDYFIRIELDTLKKIVNFEMKDIYLILETNSVYLFSL